MEKILIIDDSLVQANVLKNILHDDYEVTVTGSAVEGLRLATSGSYSLVLLDVIMPDMDGFALLKALQEEDATRNLPVILITSLSEAEHEVKGLILGAVDYIVKPFNPLVVKARVNTHVKLHRYRTQIERQAMVDELTGLANRRRYDRYCLQKWSDSIRLGTTFSVCMFDIDKFKLYNDFFGHPAGDKVLATVAKCISSHLQRSTDFTARYGGEEFVAIIQGGSAQDNFAHLQKIRRDLEGLQIPHAPDAGPWVTVSIGGVTVLPKAGDIYQNYLKTADAMLYDAKSFGRNTVVWYSDETRQLREKASESAPS